MKIIKINRGEEFTATGFLSNRNDDDFESIDATVKEIVTKVKAEGDTAIKFFDEKFGGPSKDTVNELRVSDQEIEDACNCVEPDIIEALKEAASNIRSFHEKQFLESWNYTKGENILLGQLIRPISDVGVYVPGGTAAYPSSVLMNVIPAKIAGCKRVVMCTPAGKDGKISPYILAAAKIAGADEIYRSGGAQVIAALTYGTESIKKVNKITGPGSAFVARAKKYVYGTVDIDMIAGPSEICIIADKNAKPSFIAADMLSQAEHDKMASSILITTSSDIAEKAAAEIERQLQKLDRIEFAAESIKNNAAIFIVNDLDSAFEIANDIAPEHLEIMVENPEEYLDKVLYAGAVFLGQYSSEPLGDYIAGPNHTLPTSGTAKFASPLGVYDFMTRTSIIRYGREDLEAVKSSIIKISDKEGLTAHGNAIKIRFEDI